MEVPRPKVLLCGGGGECLVRLLFLGGKEAVKKLRSLSLGGGQRKRTGVAFSGEGGCFRVACKDDCQSHFSCAWVVVVRNKGYQPRVPAQHGWVSGVGVSPRPPFQFSWKPPSH